MIDGKQLSEKLVGSDDERAVSPVIGVILMVAITVILAAVIAAFVLDLGGSVGSEAQAGVSVDGDGTTNVTLSVDSMGNADGVYVVPPDSEAVTGNNWDSPGSLDSAANLTSVGASATMGTDNGLGSGTYTVVAYLGESPDNAETSTSVQDFQLTD